MWIRVSCVLLLPLLQVLFTLSIHAVKYDRFKQHVDRADWFLWGLFRNMQLTGMMQQNVNQFRLHVNKDSFPLKLWVSFHIFQYHYRFCCFQFDTSSKTLYTLLYLDTFLCLMKTHDKASEYVIFCVTFVRAISISR